MPCVLWCTEQYGKAALNFPVHYMKLEPHQLLEDSTLAWPRTHYYCHVLPNKRWLEGSGLSLGGGFWWGQAQHHKGKQHPFGGFVDFLLLRGLNDIPWKQDVKSKYPCWGPLKRFLRSSYWKGSDWETIRVIMFREANGPTNLCASECWRTTANSGAWS